ncbi:MAG: FmdB family zinc ribbon protein [Thermoleophilia bacterium]
MPIYEYRCLKCGHQFEKMQKISDSAVSHCEKCGKRVTRVFHPVAIHFKGSGFYSTDYGKKKTSRVKEAEKSVKRDENKPKKKAAAKSDN